MNLPSIDQSLELVAWFFASVNLILALYILVLNARHIAAEAAIIAGAGERRRVTVAT